MVSWSESLDIGIALTKKLKKIGENCLSFSHDFLMIFVSVHVVAIRT